MSADWKDLSREGDPEARRLLVLEGEDTERFLQGTVSQDVEKIEDGEARPASLLTVKGKLVSDAIMMRLGEDRYGMAVPASLADEVYANLDRHIIMDEVEVSVDGEAGLAWSSGPVQADGVRCFKATYPATGHLLVGAPAALSAALSDANALEDAAWARRRIEQGVPAWGFEIEAGRFPPEVGFVDSVSYDKGCFMGQEPLARIHARGQVNRVLVRVEAPAGTAAPALPAALEHTAQGEVGHLTTVAAGETGLVGLAVVRRKVADEGTSLSAGDATFTVASKPLGDDPGVGGRHDATATVKLGGPR